METFRPSLQKGVTMSVVDVVAIHIGKDDQFELRAFDDGPVSHRESYARVILEPCEGSEPMLSIARGQRLIRLACEGSEILWRDVDGGHDWRVEAESRMLDAETGESFVRLGNASVQVGDLLYVVERQPAYGRPRRRLLGRVRHVFVFA